MNALVLAVARRAIHELDLDCGIKEVISKIDGTPPTLQILLESDAPTFIREIGAMLGV